MKSRNYQAALTALIALSIASSAAAEVTVAPWQIHEGNEGIISHSNPVNGDRSAYSKAQIPAENDAGWAAAPTNSAGDVFIKRKSTLRCRQQLDFTYFQTSVDVPRNTKINSFNVGYDSADDGARIYIFNSEHPNGTYDERADLVISQGRNTVGNVDLKDKIAVGANRIVIAQFDDCADGNNLSGIRIRVDGHEIQPEPEATPVQPAKESGAPATIFEHVDFRGKSQALVEGMNAGPLALGNDVASSVKVSPCWKVTLYEHGPGRGRTLELSADDSDLRNSNFNDIVSNVLVERDPNCGR